MIEKRSNEGLASEQHTPKGQRTNRSSSDKPKQCVNSGSRLSGAIRTAPGLEGGGELSESVCNSTSSEEAACVEFASFQRPVGLNGVFHGHRKDRVAQRTQAAHLTESFLESDVGSALCLLCQALAHPQPAPRVPRAHVTVSLSSTLPLASVPGRAYLCSFCNVGDSVLTSGKMAPQKRCPKAHFAHDASETSHTADQPAIR